MLARRSVGPLEILRVLVILSSIDKNSKGQLQGLYYILVQTTQL